MTDERQLKPCPLCSDDGRTPDPQCGLCHGAGVADTQAIYDHMQELWEGIRRFAKESLDEQAEVEKQRANATPRRPEPEGE